MKRISKILSISHKELQNIIDISNSLSDILIKLGYSPNGGTNYITLKNRLYNENFDLKKLLEKRKNNYRNIKLKSAEEVFVQNSTYARHNLKRRILKDNLIPYKCAICGQEPVWNGKELVLVLDHINGINNDNRLENLRFLCPNCNAQQDTFAAKNKNKH